MKRLAILSLLLLGACTHERPRIALPPADLATCADWPKAPDLPDRDGTAATQLERDNLTLEYILAGRSAWGDCKAKTDGLAAWMANVGGK